MKDKTIHQFSAGVNILLERVKTNPEEFAHDGKFSGLVDDVYTSMGKNRYEAVVGRGNLLRVLTAEELTALHDAFVVLDRPKFDAYIMKEILGAEDKNENGMEAVPPHMWYSAKLARATTPVGIHPSMLQNAYQYSEESPFAISELSKPEPKSFWSKFFNGMIGR